MRPAPRGSLSKARLRSRHRPLASKRVTGEPGKELVSAHCLAGVAEIAEDEKTSDLVVQPLGV